MITKRFKLLLSLLAVSLFTVASAQEPKFEKKKSYSKSYALSSSDKVVLNNQFGEMKIQTWDKNEVKVDVAITAKSDDEGRAQRTLDKISIDDEKNGNTVSFTTKFSSEKDKEQTDKDYKSKHESMSINYTVFLPATATLSATNQFGALSIPDYRGNVMLDSKFGSLTAGKLDNPKTVKVEFGTVDIEQVKDGSVEVNFSNGNIKGFAGTVNASFSHCGGLKLNIDNNTKGLKIDNSFSTLYLDMDRNFNGSYDIVTSFGNVDNKSSFAIRQNGDDKHGFTKRYSGTSGSGGTKVTVNSSYGEVIVGHDLKIDTSKKKAKKEVKI
jgi:hypothetical protein